MRWKEVGFVKKPHGVKGECLVFLNVKSSSWSEKKITRFRVQKKNSEVLELKVSSVRQCHKGLIVLFEKMRTPQQVNKELKGAKVFIPKSFLISKKGEQLYLIEVLNFFVFCKGECLGRIVNFSSNGHQDLLVIEKEKKRYQLPFVTEFVERIDFEKKIVFMTLPEGLVGL